jgi:hypothetical protein
MPPVYYEMIQWQTNLGPLGLVNEFLATVAVIAVVTWLLLKKRSPVCWKRTDYAYLTFAVIGGIVAAADLATSNWSNELQQNRIVSNGISSRLRDYVTVGVDDCKTITSRKKAADARQNDVIGGIIRPPPDIKPPLIPFNKNVFKVYPFDLEGYASDKVLGVGSPQFVDLTDSDCAFLERISSAITSNTLRTMASHAKWFQEDNNWEEKRSKDAIKFIASDIEAINKYSDRADELQASLSSLKSLSFLKTLSPMLLGVGVGIRLARAHSDVKKEQAAEQEKQRREAAAGMPSPAITTANGGGSASDKSTAISPPIDTTMVGKA